MQKCPSLTKFLPFSDFDNVGNVGNFINFVSFADFGNFDNWCISVNHTEIRYPFVDFVDFVNFGDFDKIAADPLTDRPEQFLEMLARLKMHKPLLKSVQRSTNGSTFTGPHFSASWYQVVPFQQLPGCKCWAGRRVICQSESSPASLFSLPVKPVVVPWSGGLTVHRGGRHCRCSSAWSAQASVGRWPASELQLTSDQLLLWTNCASTDQWSALSVTNQEKITYSPDWGPDWRWANPHTG